MAQAHGPQIISSGRHSEEQIRAAEDLAAVCNRFEGLDLSLDFTPVEPGSIGRAGQFLCYEGGSLVGFASLYGIAEPELCGMVHPDHRRKGIGMALFDAAREECRRRGLLSFELACEEASESGRAFVAAVGARYLYSEYGMVLDPAAVDRSRPRHEDLMMRRAGPEDAGALAHIVALAENMSEEQVRRTVERGMGSSIQRYYIATLRGEPVGTLRVSQHDPSTYITAFAVLPGHQGRGYGRQMLIDTIDMLLAEKRHDIRIEVETENRNAYSLYRSCGFREAHTYGYYLVTLDEGREQTTDDGR
ncbi:MAG: GNAT family N-acetyltransferase [Chloroflexia bacterium]